MVLQETGKKLANVAYFQFWLNCNPKFDRTCNETKKVVQAEGIGYSFDLV